MKKRTEDKRYYASLAYMCVVDWSKKKKACR